MKFKGLRFTMIFTLIFCLGMSGILSVKNVSAEETDIEYQPILGIRRSLTNVDAIKEKEKVENQIQRKQEHMEKLQEKMIAAQVQLNQYERIQSETRESGTVFTDNGRGTGLFSEVAQFDPYFEEIEDYGNASEVVTFSDSLEMMAEEEAEEDALQLETLAESDENTAGLLPVEVNTVDIGPYLSCQLYRLYGQIERMKENLEDIREKLDALEKTRDSIQTDNIVFNAENVKELSHISVKRMQQILRGTALERFADVYVDIEKEYGINAIAMCAISAYESAWGESRRAKVDNNYTGYGVYSDSSVGINASSGEENLRMTAGCLARCYLNWGDIYYHGVGLDGLNRSYSTAGSWAHDIEYIANQLMNKLQSVLY